MLRMHAFSEQSGGFPIPHDRCIRADPRATLDSHVLLYPELRMNLMRSATLQAGKFSCRLRCIPEFSSLSSSNETGLPLICSAGIRARDGCLQRFGPLPFVHGHDQSEGICGATTTVPFFLNCVRRVRFHGRVGSSGSAAVSFPDFVR